MQLPTDPPPPPVAPDANITDTAPPSVTAKQRSDDFNRIFTWRGHEIAITIAGELYFRELRTHCNAPPLGSYTTSADFSAEATRILYCAHLSLGMIRRLRTLPADLQIQAWEEWIEKNILFHEINAAIDLAQEMQQCIARARTQPADTGSGDAIDGAGNSPSQPAHVI